MNSFEMQMLLVSEKLKRTINEMLLICSWFITLSII